MRCRHPRCKRSGIGDQVIFPQPLPLLTSRPVTSGGGRGGGGGTVPGDHMLEDVYGPFLLLTNLRKLGKGYRARLDHADRNQPLHPKPFPLSMQRVLARVHIKFVLT